MKHPIRKLLSLILWYHYITLQTITITIKTIVVFVCFLHSLLTKLCVCVLQDKPKNPHALVPLFCPHDVNSPHTFPQKDKESENCKTKIQSLCATRFFMHLESCNNRDEGQTLHKGSITSGRKYEKVYQKLY